MEFAAELADFINRDLFRLDPDRARDMRVRALGSSQAHTLAAASHQFTIQS